MKKLLPFLMSLIALLLLTSTAEVSAQSPQGFNYQAVIRNADGTLRMNESAIFRFTISSTTSTSGNLYQETSTLTTNEYGLVDHVVGSGTRTTGSGPFSSINWNTSGSRYLIVEINTPTGYVEISDDRLQSVPYALFANEVAGGSSPWTISGSNAYRTTGRIGIGLTNPTEKLEIRGDGFSNFLRINAGGTSAHIAGIKLMEPGLSFGWQLRMRAQDDRFALAHQDGSSVIDRFTVEKDGKVGISNSAPSELLELASFSSGQDNYISIRTAGGNQYKAGIKFNHFSTGIGFLIQSSEVDNLFTINRYANSTNPIAAISINRLDGNVGINTSSNSERLTVNGNIYAVGGDLITSASNGVINVGGSINDLANVIGDNATPTITFATGDEDLFIEDDLEVRSSAYKPGGGSWSTVSDRRLKKNITPFDSGLDLILQIDPVEFEYIDRLDFEANRRFVGVIAQDIQKIAPYMVEEKAMFRVEAELADGSTKVIEEGERFYSFDGSALTYITINAIKEQEEKIQNLETTLADQESQINDLTQRLLMLERKLETNKGDQ